MTPATITKRVCVTVATWAVLFYVHSVLEASSAPLETAVALRQARDAAPLPAHGIIRLDIPSLVLYCLLVVSVFVIWAVPRSAKEEN